MIVFLTIALVFIWMTVALLADSPGFALPLGAGSGSDYLFHAALAAHLACGLALRWRVRDQLALTPWRALRLALFLGLPITAPSALCVAAGSAVRSVARYRYEDQLHAELQTLSQHWRRTGGGGAMMGAIWGLAALLEVSDYLPAGQRFDPLADPLTTFGFFAGTFGNVCRYGALVGWIWVSHLLVRTQRALQRHADSNLPIARGADPQG